MLLFLSGLHSNLRPLQPIAHCSKLLSSSHLFPWVQTLFSFPSFSALFLSLRSIARSTCARSREPKKEFRTSQNGSLIDRLEWQRGKYNAFRYRSSAPRVSIHATSYNDCSDRYTLVAYFLLLPSLPCSSLELHNLVQALVSQ